MSSGFSTAEKRRRYGRPCACGCGRLTNGSGGSTRPALYVKECSRRLRRERAQAKVIAAIRDWHQKYGRLPTAREWRLGVSPYPVTSDVQQYFGSWSEGIRAAGFEPRQNGEREILYRQRVA